MFIIQNIINQFLKTILTKYFRELFLKIVMKHIQIGQYQILENNFYTYIRIIFSKNNFLLMYEKIVWT